MDITRQNSALASGFIASMRECMPDTAPVRETLSFISLVLHHPSPPREVALMRRSLWSLVTMNAVGPTVAAEQMRRVANDVLSDCNHSTSGQVLEMALHTLSLRFDDRPSARMLCVDLGTMAAGMSVIGIEDVVPVWSAQLPIAGLMSPGPVYEWIGAHVARVCSRAFDQTGCDDAYKNWSSTDFECAFLALRMLYCVFGRSMDGSNSEPSDLIVDFDLHGLFLWDTLQQKLMDRPQRSASSVSLRDPTWHATARDVVRQAIGLETGRTPQPKASSAVVDLGPSHAPRLPNLRVAAPISGPSLVVCRTPIVGGTERCDKEEIARHKILETPLPLAVLPHFEDLLGMHRALVKEFPWAGDVLWIIFGDLVGRAKLGVQTFAFPPTLLVGEPGSGKSRLARRLADSFGLPRMDLSLGGVSDSKVLSGTSRGWASAKPGDLATLMALRGTASALVLLDELDKAEDGDRVGVGLQSYLLGLLEPETASRLMDSFLKTECDYSGVMWIGTANELSTVHAPLLSRLRVLPLRQPSAEHFGVIADNVLTDIAKSWSLDRQVLPVLAELTLPWDRLGSARQVRKAVEGAVVAWASALQRH